MDFADGRAAVDELIDWGAALRTATWLSRPGPILSPAEAADAVAQLRACAAAAVNPVAEVSQLSAPTEIAPLIVDRPGWSRANVRGFRTMLAPVLEEAVERRGRAALGSISALGTVGSLVTGAELGSLLAFLSARVLGQYDPFAEQPRLLLVAPNIVQVERELAAVPADFRLWVCLHEETHRVQFGATPWLADHILTEVRTLVGELVADPGQVAERVAGALRNLPGVARGEGSPSALLDAVQTPAQRERLAAITAIMSLLEGHADVVMDQVGPQVVPTVRQIRERFNRRRAGRGAVDRVLRRLLGLEAKMRQYADGARFVRGVQDRVGIEGLNAVWASPDHLPRPAEIADPEAWIRRVL